jgi:hypothetical protein
VLKDAKAVGGKKTPFYALKVTPLLEYLQFPIKKSSETDALIIGFPQNFLK